MYVQLSTVISMSKWGRVLTTSGRRRQHRPTGLLLVACWVAHLGLSVEGGDCPAMSAALDVMAYLKEEETAAAAASESANRALVVQNLAFESTRQGFEARLRQLDADISAQEKTRFELALAGAELSPTDAALASLRAEHRQTTAEQGSVMDREKRVLRQVEEAKSRREEELAFIAGLIRESRRHAHRVLEGQLAAGHDHSCALHRNGSLLCWGRNDMGQAELPEDISEDISTNVPSPLRIWQVAVGDGNTCIIVSGIASDVIPNTRAHRELRCWGNNVFGKSTPPPLSHVTQVCATVVILMTIFIGSLKAGFVTERSKAGSCRAFRVQYPIDTCAE